MLVLCDGLKSYSSLGIEYGCSVKDVNYETDKFFHLNNVNCFHSFIKQKYDFYRGVATKYLNRYNALFSIMYRAGKSFIKSITNMLCADNSKNSHFSKNTLKTLYLLAL
jgi:hypothetical protein